LASAAIFFLSTRSRPPGGGAQEPLEPGLGGQHPGEPVAFGPGQLVGSLDRLVELGDHPLAYRRVAGGLVGVEADHEAVVTADVDFLDLKVVAHGGIAALPGESGPDLVRSGAELLADDVAAAPAYQRPAVGGGGEAAVGDPHDLRERPLAQITPDLTDQSLIAGVTGPGPHPHRDAVAGDGHADDDLRQVLAGVLGLAVGAKSGVAHGLLGRRVVGQTIAARVPGDGLVTVLGLEVRAGGVEEQQVHLQVEQVGDLEVRLLGQGGLDGEQIVHRPVAGFVTDRFQALYVDVASDPLGRGELAGGGQRPVGDQREQHPLHPRIQPPPGQLTVHDTIEAQTVPQPVECVHPAPRARTDQRQIPRTRRGQRGSRIQQLRERPDQPADRLTVEFVLPAEGVQHLRT
jgi:hypothetical protein